MNLPRLRQILAGQIHSLSQSHGHKDLAGVADLLGIGFPGSRSDGSKAERMRAAFKVVSDNALPEVARRLLDAFPPGPQVRYEIEEILWIDDRSVVIPKRYRRDLGTNLALDGLWSNDRHFSRLLERFWVLCRPTPFCGGHGSSLRSEIEQHVFRNKDLTTEDLFDHLGAYECSDRRFAEFIEALSGPDVRPEVEDQRRFVGIVNKALSGCGVELVEMGESGGYPMFNMVAKAPGTPGRPKNLIFASSVKPDLRFRDAINNDIEIVTNADKVLV